MAVPRDGHVAFVSIDVISWTQQKDIPIDKISVFDFPRDFEIEKIVLKIMWNREQFPRAMQLISPTAWGSLAQMCSGSARCIHC